MIERLIADYKGQKEGPLLIVVGGLHGNEMAGIHAIKQLYKMLLEENYKDASFLYKGRFVGIVGNITALLQKKRLLDLDLNRIWLENHNDIAFSSEYKEMIAMQKMIYAFVNDHPKDHPIYIMDLHTTSSPRGIFAVCTNTEQSKNVTGRLHCPVIVNMTDQLHGSMIQYYATHSIDERTIVSFAFEGGQHDDGASTSRLIAAMVNCMRSIGAVLPENVESHHDKVLREYAHGLPKYCKITYIHQIEDGRLWKMKPGYYGFQEVHKGEVVAKYNGQEVKIPHDGLILMPLYQENGKEGFFIVNVE
ncbi:MAG TPA: succinylglutamate desuccinylase/aspartoacylase family protein [Saprospiraceae bacterium]|nr:succinylglutamate desuccinylase/aspartoacylase family protein [Saprospiraceae bacterium]